MNVRAFRLRPIAEFLQRRTACVGWGALATSLPGLALAGPTGENVVAGAAAIHRPDATHTQIDQSTQRAVVNWSTFSIDNDEYVIFNQPGATASILNRVVGSQISTILGQMQANGRVFLVNPQGIYFGPGSTVDVGALTASVLDIADRDFMSGNYVFTRPEGAPDGASVENAGEIKVGDGGYVVLAGDYVNNTGVISARLGTVVLAAGSRMTLDLSADGLVSFAVDEATVASLAGVNNAGEISADGGQVIMTAKVANGLVATAVNNDGLLQAHRIVEDGGEIYLSASGGDIVNAGAIDVAGAAGQSGGEVGITGDQDITLTAGSQINANGDGAGNGGVVNVIADGTMAFREGAEIAALAGDSGERGGSVHLSGHDGIQVKGTLAIRDGEVLIDPADLVLDSGSASYGSIGTGYIEGVLDGNNNLTLWATNSISKTAGATSIVATGTGNLRLAIGSSDGSVQSPSGDINLAGLEIDIGGDFSATAGFSTGDVHLGKVAANNVRIFAGVLGAGGEITLNTGGVTAASSVLRMSASGDITVGTPTIPGHVTLTGPRADMDIDANTGDLTVYGDLIATATSVSFGTASIDASAQNITVRDVIAIGSGDDADISFDASNNIMVRNVSATVGGGSFGDASIDFSAGNNITVNNLTARASSESAFIEMWADNNLRIDGITTAVAKDELSISYSASNTVVINNTINVTGSSYIDIEIEGDNGVTTKGINAFANTYEASISITAFSGTVNVDGAIVASGSYVDIDIEGDNGVTTKAISALATSDSASIDIRASNGIINIDGAVVARSMQDDAEVYLDGEFGVNTKSIDAIAGGAFGSASIHIDAFGTGAVVNVDGQWRAVAPNDFAGAYIHTDWTTGTVNVNSPVVVSGTAGSFSASGNNVNLNGNVNVTATSYAAVYAWARNNLKVPGDIKVSEAGGGSAMGYYFFGNDGTFGRQDIIAGPGGYASAYFGTSEGFAGKTVTFNKPVTVKGPLGSSIYVDVENSIRTSNTGLLYAQQIFLNTRGDGTTTIDVKTMTPMTYLQNTGFTPNVVLDNRAFAGPSTIFSPFSTVLKSATFLATGPLLVDGSFIADRLAVEVANGSVTFAHPINITGANPFAPSLSDLALFEVMTANGLTPPLHGPNVQISALTGITMNEPFNVGGPSPFTKMFTNGPLNISGLTTSADNILAVFSPIDPTRPFFFENEPFPPPPGASALFNFPTLQGLPDTTGATVVVGEIGPTGPVLSGPVTIGSKGLIDMGNQNGFIITRGAVSGEDQVIANIFEIIGIAPPVARPQPPYVDEIDEEKDEEEDELALVDEGAEGGDETEITEEETVPKEMECS